MTSGSGAAPGDGEDLADRVLEAFDLPEDHPWVTREEAEMGASYFHCLEEVQRCAELLARGDVRGLRDAAEALSDVAEELAQSGIRETGTDPDPQGRQVAKVAAYWGVDHAASRRLVAPRPALGG